MDGNKGHKSRDTYVKPTHLHLNAFREGKIIHIASQRAKNQTTKTTKAKR